LAVTVTVLTLPISSLSHVQVMPDSSCLHTAGRGSGCKAKGIAVGGCR
jgi:hypothetical protein